MPSPQPVAAASSGADAGGTSALSAGGWLVEKLSGSVEAVSVATLDEEAGEVAADRRQPHVPAWPQQHSCRAGAAQPSRTRHGATTPLASQAASTRPEVARIKRPYRRLPGMSSRGRPDSAVNRGGALRIFTSCRRPLDVKCPLPDNLGGCEAMLRG